MGAGMPPEGEMASRRLPFLWPALCLLAVLAGCGRPSSVEMYVRSDKAADGVYIFDFELDDSLATYDFSFYGRSVGNTLYNVPLKVLWLTPSGESLNETVYMRAIAPEGTMEPYRSSVVPYEYGSWRLSVRPMVEEGEIYGLGLICTRTDGTR